MALAHLRQHSTRSAPTALALLAAVLITACENPQPPASCGTVPEQTIHVGESATVSVCFSDPNEDMLTFAATSSDPGVAAVAGAGGTVTVTAVSPGTAVVTVTATDPGGLMAQQSFRVVVPNRAPAAVGSIVDRELMVGDTATLDVAARFSEPDGQALTYSAASADPARVTVSAQGTTVTLVALAKGTVAVTVTATDPGGLTATQSFQVTVPNRAPVAVDSIPARIVEVGRTDTIIVSSFFTDPDGDTLSYAAALSDSARVAALVASDTITVTALAKGEAAVTITATDNEGASAAHTFRVTVPNRPPAATDSIPSLSLFIDESDTLDLTRHFGDPDGDPLTWSAEVSNSKVAAVELSRGTGALTVTAVSQGDAVITVTATDDEGLTAQQSFPVTVPNRPPTSTGVFHAQALFKRDTVRFELGRYFADPDRDTLDYAATSSDIGVATVTVAGATLAVRTMGAGEATITVTATDPGALQARQSFTVRVQNRGPRGTAPIPAHELVERQSVTLDMASHFEDPDGDLLTYTAVTSNARVATVRVSRSDVTVRGVLRGEAEITVTATDPDGASVAQHFMVTVERVTMDFDIGLGFGPDVTASQQRVLRNAASYWMSALRFTEFEDIEVNDRLTCRSPVVTAEVTVGTIDDVGIVFTVADIDGDLGTLALAGPCFVRTRGGMPLLGIVVFDRADIDLLAGRGSMTEVAVHEIAHVLGLGTLWDRGGLLRDPSETDPGADTHFAGPLATVAFDAAGGSDYAGAKVPVENGGDDGHWRESVFGRELMSPKLTVGAANPLSEISLQALADMGYDVDVSRARPYRLPPAGAVAAVAEAGLEVLDYGRDVLRGPIGVVDADGQLVEVIGEEQGTELRLRSDSAVVRITLGN